MNQRLVRFKENKTLRSYFVNRIFVDSLGKTKAQIIDSVDTWPKQELAPQGLTLDQLRKNCRPFLRWAIDDFTFFSWNKSGQLILDPENVETCLLVDRLLQEPDVDMGDNAGEKEGTIVWAWKKGHLEELRKLGKKHLRRL